MKNNEKGFTLVELLPVIAIIGVLIGLLIPSGVSEVREAAAKQQRVNASANGTCYSCQP